MTGKETDRGGREWTCGDCGTVLLIAASGVVGDIYEAAA